jgi:hypothetical protein
MPRGRRAKSIPRRRRRDGRLEDIVSRHVSDLIEAVKKEVRRSVTDEVRAFLTTAKVDGGAKLVIKRGRRRRVLPCIAPNCANPSKGPRFHYLCEKHKDASKKDYEAWRRARHEKQAKQAKQAA